MTAARPAVLRLVIAFLAAALLLLGGAAAAVAVSVPPRPESGAVRDQADILNPDQERELDQRIRGLGIDSPAARAVKRIGDDMTAVLAATATTAAVNAACHRQGLVTLTAGTFGNVLRLLPPLTSPDHLLAEGLDILDDAFAEVLGG